MGLELLLNAEMRRADAMTIADGTPGRTLMERAGAAVTAAVARRCAAGERVLVLCGPGNNGGDGFVAARLLAARGHQVSLALLGDGAALRGDAALAAAEWTGPVAAPGSVAVEAAGLIVDALFGTGLGRDLDGEALALVERINASGRRVVAVDIPSGINGDSGAVCGAAVRATHTVTFARRKPAHLLLPGRVYCGTVEVADIGITDATVAACASDAFANAPPLWRGHIPVPSIEGHKYKRGHALVVSGGPTATGAARLAARAALRAGAGLVTVASPPDAVMVNAAHLTAIMLRPMEGAAGLARLLDDRRFNVLLIGPGAGVGQATADLVAIAGGRQRSLVLDADALTSFAGNAAGLRQVVASCHPAAVILTPHGGEFAALFKAEDEVVRAPTKLDQARRAAAVTGAVVVLKGADTVIAAPDGRAAINENAPAWLGTAGSGDVLAGIAAGLLAQGMNGFEAAAAAVWMHGEAATMFGPGLISEDLAEVLPKVLSRLMGATA
ncbi:NAD(P)H-hydrate dehydratase [Chelatococcus reniformis]|uniref:Bifunctional NAD(P)H-hydrate repair enzyme n=1 Tax=Chelatococcus reniformis TaxID=1494448 RepID=A0A916U1N4_9HYPH|nr:NAD(P)H-hydrate dehydratase [Chelatococcus reniformis]GGC55971.1 bifunctional NAD(P)H-hydrate repair enzyme [Chelatococcus reniformis]